jgi:hypothetical protein
MGYSISDCVDTGGIPMYLINEFLSEIEIPICVELGTASGGSAKEAAKYFNEVMTVELNEYRPIYDSNIKNITWLNGNSIDVLPGIIKSLISYKEENLIEYHRYCLFWVDSHFDGDKPKDSPYKDCYLLDELEIISPYSQDAIIIIDDARLFMGNPPYPNKADEWPTIQQVFGVFRERFPYHFTTIVDDYILSIPDRLKWIYDRLWMRDYKKRFPDDEDKIRSAAKLAFDSFIKYIR